MGGEELENTAAVCSKTGSTMYAVVVEEESHARILPMQPPA